MASEFALAFMLLIGAGLMIRSFSAMQSVDPGFNPHNVLSMVVSVAGSQEAPPERRAYFYRQLIDRVRTLPGVASAGGINHLPLAGDIWGSAPIRRVLVARTAVLVLLSVAAGSQGFGQHGSLDPAFEKVPFDQWFAGAQQARIRWTARVSRAQLSAQQRLLAQVEVQADGRELAKRRGAGQLLIFVEFSDREGRRYQIHSVLDLDKVGEGIKASDVVSTEGVFVVPGDYRVRVALFFTSTREHCVKEDTLHVPPLKNDPLPDSWRDLPPVEFLPTTEPPDAWYLPAVSGRLRLPLETRRPVRIEVLVNLTPSERASGSNRVQDRNLGNLIPALKAISQVESRGAPLDVALLDLSRQRVTFHQDDVRDLDWPAMKDALAENPGTIDLKSLQNRRQDAQFFLREVARRIAAAPDQPPRALIVLSSPVEFESREDLQPIRVPRAPDCRVFYVRYGLERERAPALPSFPTPGRRMGGPPISMPRSSRVPIDQLASTLKPLAPRLFDVETPEQFRKALAAILAEISRM